MGAAVHPADDTTDGDRRDVVVAARVPAPEREVDALLVRLDDAREACAEVHDVADLVEQVVRATLGIADAVARRYADRGIELDDLEQVARLGLVKAVLRYRPATGTPFAGYAVPTVVGEVKRYFRDHGWLVRPPRCLQEARARLHGVEDEVRQQLLREPTDAEVAAAAGLTPRELREARSAAQGYGGVELVSAHERAADATDLEHVETRDALRRAVSELSARERRVLGLRFVQEQTQAEIARDIGVSQMQVSRILRATLTDLRARLQDHGDRVADDGGCVDGTPGTPCSG